MKKLKKLLSVALTAAAMSLMIVGCGGPKTTPEEAVKIQLDVMMKADKSQIDKINMTEEEFNSKRNELEESFVKQLGGTSYNLSDEDINNIKDAFLVGLSKVSYEVEESKIDKDSATVNVKIKGIDFKAIMNNAQAKLVEKIQADPSLATDQNKAMKESFALMAEEFKNAPIVDDARDVEFKLTKEKNVWVVSDASFADLVSALYRF